MKFDVNAVRQRATTVFSGFTAGQRATLGIAVLAVFIGGYLTMQWSSKPAWTPLYSGLSPEDAAEVTAELDSLGVAYQLTNGGTAVEVSPDALYRTRIDLAAAGVPSGGTGGYELLEGQSLTTSQFEQRVNYQRAIEGEIAKTIAALDDIDTATVHLVMPEDDLFTGDTVKPTASILLHTVGDKALGASQVQAIVNLTAGSVEGLTPDNVTVADAAGRVLSAPGAEGGIDIAATEQQVAQKSAYEAAAAQAIETQLAKVTGPDKVQVVVAADLDFDTRKSVSTSYGDAETAPVGSESVSTETYTGTGQVVGGVLGPDVIPAANDGAAETQYDKEDATRNYLVDEVTQETIAAPGSVRRLSVSVLVDESAGVDTAEIADLVSAGAGLQPDRGDTIVVQAMEFADVATDAEGEGTSSTEGGSSMVPTLARTGGVVLLVLVVLLLAYRSAKKSSLAKYPVAIPLPALDDDDDALAALGTRSELDLTELEPPSFELISNEVPEHVLLQNSIGELIDRQPEEVAAVLRTWLADRRS